jgi:hypothetical protein
MPPFIRRWKGWDWFTPAPVRHLPFEEREKYLRKARELARQSWEVKWRPGCQLAIYFLVLNCVLSSFVGALSPQHPLWSFWGGLVTAIVVAISLYALWHERRLYRQALRQVLFEASVCPCYCFDCGYYLEGFEGRECPVCGVVVRKAVEG